MYRCDGHRVTGDQPTTHGVSAPSGVDRVAAVATDPVSEPDLEAEVEREGHVKSESLEGQDGSMAVKE